LKLIREGFGKLIGYFYKFGDSAIWEVLLFGIIFGIHKDNPDFTYDSITLYGLQGALIGKAGVELFYIVAFALYKIGRFAIRYLRRRQARRTSPNTAQKKNQGLILDDPLEAPNAPQVPLIPGKKRGKK
jgi:hypothetical protein